MMCKRCGVVLTDLNAYRYSTTGKYRGKCKRCLLDDQINYRNTDRGKEKDRRYAKTEKRNETLKKYRRSDKGKAVLRRAYHNRQEHKNKARQAVSNAIYRGDLVKGSMCEFCNKEGVLEGHHWCYSEVYWLDIIWLCEDCHCKVHGKTRRKLH